MEGTIISRGVRSKAITVATAHRSAHQFPIRVRFADVDRSVLLLRNAVASLVLTLALVPAGVRALLHAGMGWEAWTFSPLLILPVVLFHFLWCWVPLALRYFKRGECHDVPAFVIATVTLFTQIIICYAVFDHYSVWFGGAI